MQPEMTRNVQQQSKAVYLRAQEALHCRVHSTLVLPLYRQVASGYHTVSWLTAQWHAIPPVYCTMHAGRCLSVGCKAGQLLLAWLIFLWHSFLHQKGTRPHVQDSDPA